MLTLEEGSTIAAIQVVDYSPGWVELFDTLRDTVIAGLGDLATAIEHIGSTSIPGLSAKPIIDMDVVVATEEDVTKAIQRLATLGYVHEGNLGIPGREAFTAPQTLPHHHLYLCTSNNAEYRRHVLFRDYMRSHPEDAKKYGELKVELAKRFSNDREAYTNAKGVFVQEILKRAGWE